MLRNIQRLSLWQRRLVFFLIFGGILMALLAFTWLLVRQSLFGGPRVQGVALVPEVTVREFVTLTDADAYPAALAVGPDGTIYTGSYTTGVVWRITPDGATVSEIPGTRDTIGAVSAIAVLADGALLIVDQDDADPRTAGGRVWRVTNERVAPFIERLGDEAFVTPNDIALDSAGHIYLTDPGRNEVWRFEADGSGGTVWWVPPAPTASAEGSTPRRGLTGLAYDATRDALVVTDPEVNEIFRIRIADGSSELLYTHTDRTPPPGFDGAVVTPDGTLYVAALGTNGVARIDDDGTLNYIAGNFRGVSDVDVAASNRLYVTNFDQASLAPIVLPLFAPQLPFALDVIELAATD